MDEIESEGKTPLMIRVSPEYHDEVAKKAKDFAGMGISMQKFGKFAYTLGMFIGEEMTWDANKAFVDGHYSMVLLYTLRRSFAKSFEADKKAFAEEILTFNMPGATDGSKVSIPVGDVIDALILLATHKLVLPKNAKLEKKR